MARRYEQVVEPRTKARIFGDDAAVVFWVVLGPVVHQPALGDVIAVHVVERRAFQEDLGIALVVVAGVVGVLLLPPVVQRVQPLRQIPLAHRGHEGRRRDFSTRGVIGVVVPGGALGACLLRQRPGQ